MIKLVRSTFDNVCTEGIMYYRNEYLCDTIEPPFNKCKGCIPAGVYTLSLTHSNTFKRTLPLIENVPNFAGIRIHRGNSAYDTKGCILVGKKVKLNWISFSADTEKKIIDFIKENKITKIEII